MIGLGLGLTAVGKGSVTPPPGPTPLTTLVIEGDSQTAAGGSYASQWLTANPTIAASNIAVGGAGLGTEANAGDASNTLWGRANDVIEAAPDLLTVLIGGNDDAAMGVPATAQGFVDSYLAYVDHLRAVLPELRVVVGTVLPDGSGTLQNANRAIVNPLLEAEIGGRLYDIFDIGGHPAMADAAASESTYFGPDHVHLNEAGQALAYAVYRAVLDPIRDQVMSAAATLLTPFSDATNIKADTLFEETVIVTGLTPGSKAAVSCDVGAVAIGRGAFSTTPGSVRNGQTVTRRHAASSAPGTTVTQTITIGSATFRPTVTTAQASAVGLVGLPKLSAADDTAPSMALTLPDAGRVIMMITAGDNPQTNAAAITIKKDGILAATGTIREFIGGNVLVTFDEELPAGSYTFEPVWTVAVATAAYPALLTDSSSGTPATTGREVLYGYQNGGTIDCKASSTVPAPWTQVVPNGGLGVVIAQAGGGFDGETYGNTEIYEYEVDRVKWFTFDTSKVPQIGNREGAPTGLFCATFR